MARYRAVRDGYTDHYVRAGEILTLEGPAPSWVVALEEAPVPRSKDAATGEAPVKKSHKKKVG